MKLSVSNRHKGKKLYTEIWKPVKDYPNYMVSSIGRVKSLNYSRTGKEKILKLSKNKKGYLKVDLYKDGVRKLFLVSRLVAFAFIPNPKGKPCIDHIDTNKENNRVENLKWVTNKENCNNPLSRKHNSEARKGENSGMYGHSVTDFMTEEQIEQWKKNLSIANSGKNSIPVVQLTLDGEFVREWDSAVQVKKESGFDASAIRKCCKGIYSKKNIYKGFRWLYYEDYIKITHT